MQPRLTARPVEQVISAIQALDLESVKVRVMDAEVGEGWTREYADSIEAAYKNYLTMAVKYQDAAEDILLNKDVDEFWHTHILQTMKYAQDCENVFGTFLHHSPHIGERTPAVVEKRAELAEKTRHLYEREFGSVERAEAAWSGDGIAAANTAMSSIAIRAEKAALSSIAIRAENAALSSIAIRAENAALSSIAIRAENAALSSIAIRPENAALSSIAIRPENAALSSIAIRAENTALSSIAIPANNATVPGAVMRT
ncbi:MAG: hypothetical protein HY527_00555 [Betaproteobacteria bacterium]|nr:hypothetical protein [Betaproteobacteria bacterium]